MDLTRMTCKPCEGGVPKFNDDEIRRYNSELKTPWTVLDGMKIKKTFKFPDYRLCVDFAVKVAGIAESENHHPVIHIFYSKVDIELWTHAILGLSENDFIVASKIDALMK